MKIQQTNPTRIDIAFRALAYTHSIEMGGTIETPHGSQTVHPRILTKGEVGMRNTAAEVIRNFIAGEIDPSTCVPAAREALWEDGAPNVRPPHPKDPSRADDMDDASDIPW
jgi:hypothetical protein